MKKTLWTIVSLLVATGAAHASVAVPAPEIGSGLIGGGAVIAGLLISAAVMKFRQGVGGN